MARPLRIQFRNAAYHVTCRGIRKDAIFFADHDRFEFVRKMNETFEKYSFILNAFCLMPNHYHLFLQTPLANLSEGLHHLNSAYSNWLKSKHKLVGHVFQGRFKSILVDEETYAVNLSIYIHLNPCRWGLAKKPEDYAWSSCRDYLGMRGLQTPALQAPRILSILTSDDTNARTRYRELLRERRDMDDPLKASFRRIALGSPSFIDRIRQLINERAAAGKTRENSARDFKACQAVSPAQVFEIIAAVSGCAVSDILTKKRGRPWRAMGMYLVKKHCAIGLRKAGEIWGVDYAVVGFNARRFAADCGGSETLAPLLTAAEARISGLRKNTSLPIAPGSLEENLYLKT
ncbi:MAG: transposase [Candidatus Aminicenantes bacterium]|nr:transposase [Candidatus Aminicenantes bacterium]